MKHPHALRRPATATALLVALALSFAGCDADASAPRAAAAPTDRPGVASAIAAAADPVPDADGKVRLTEAEWRARLTPEQFRILRGSATERPFSCELWKISDAPGVYHCAGCGLALFNSADKFDSGTGWPSFTRPVAADRIVERADKSHGMTRVETVCARCDGHLGHVFPDGPPPTGLRYCINGSVLRFEAAEAAATEEAPPAKGKP